VAEARTHLEQALRLAPEADHIYYALALAQALGGDLAGAHENMKRAIELEPRNRIMARQDADFAALANQPPFNVLLYPERKGR
jgi:Flp pilus assembly protein TadD